MPEWVHVWFWLRFIRGVVSPLPQQEHDDPMAMSVDEYERFRNEWELAGAPKATPRHLIAAMSGDRLNEEVPF